MAFAALDWATPVMGVVEKAEKKGEIASWRIFKD
jgi:hypothetical protein